MAVAVSRCSIKPETASSIRKMLCFQPECNSRYAHLVAREPVLFYLLDDETVHLPYRFGASLLGAMSTPDKPKVDLKFTGSLLAHQEPVAAEAFNQLQTYGTTTIGLYPGFGKTVVGALLACKLGLVTVVLVTRQILTTQWKTTFESFTDAPVSIVGVDPLDRPVLICMDGRIDLIPDKDKIGLVIIDEAHLFCTPNRVRCLLAFHPRYVIAETATLIREDGMHKMIQSICGTHGIFIASSKPFQVTKLVTGIKPERERNSQGGVDWAALTRSLLFNQKRNALIVSIVEANPTMKILILTSQVEHVLYLHEEIKKKGISCDYMAGSKKSYEDNSVLIGTISKLGTGFDQATSCGTWNGVRINLLILCCSFKKEALLEQNIGRVFRAEFPYVVHLVDDDNIIKSHWTVAAKWYKARNGTVVEHRIR